MLAAVDAVLGVPFYITYYCADVDSPKADVYKRQCYNRLKILLNKSERNTFII